MPVKKIEVNFAIPVELTQAEMQLIDTIANDAARRTETDKVVHWAAGCGDKPNWSKTDCAIFGYEPTPDSPESGEPTFDSTIFCVETFARERYESEPFDPTKRKTPIADLLFSIRYPNPHSGTFQIREERVRQMQVEGWTKEHDDEHKLGELSAAAFCYTLAAHAQVEELGVSLDDMFKDFTTKDDLWPWEPQWLKLSPDPIRNLVKAGALIAAEIDRLQRKAKKG